MYPQTAPPQPPTQRSGRSSSNRALAVIAVILATVAVGLIGLLAALLQSDRGRNGPAPQGGVAATSEPALTTTTAAQRATTASPPRTPATTPATVAVTAPATAPPTVPSTAGSRSGTVVRTCGASGNGDCFLSIRPGPNSDGAELARLDEGDSVSVVCQVTGERVTSSILGTPTNIWLRLPNGNFVTAAFVSAPGWSTFDITTPC